MRLRTGVRRPIINTPLHSVNTAKLHPAGNHLTSNAHWLLAPPDVVGNWPYNIAPYLNWVRRADTILDATEPMTASTPWGVGWYIEQDVAAYKFSAVANSPIDGSVNFPVYSGWVRYFVQSTAGKPENFCTVVGTYDGSARGWHFKSTFDHDDMRVDTNHNLGATNLDVTTDDAGGTLIAGNLYDAFFTVYNNGANAVTNLYLFVNGNKSPGIYNANKSTSSSNGLVYGSTEADRVMGVGARADDTLGADFAPPPGVVLWSWAGPLFLTERMMKFIIQDPYVLVEPYAPYWMPGYADAGGPVTVSPGVTALTFAGQVPTVDNPRVVTPPVEALTFLGYAPTVDNPRVVTPPAEALTFAGQVPTIDNPRTITPPAEALTFAGQVPTVDNPRVVTPPAEALTFAGQVPTLVNPRTVTPPAEALTFAGQVPTVDDGADITILPPVEALTFAGIAPGSVIYWTTPDNASTSNPTDYVAFDWSDADADTTSSHPSVTHHPTGLPGRLGAGAVVVTTADRENQTLARETVGFFWTAARWGDPGFEEGRNWVNEYEVPDPTLPDFHSDPNHVVVSGTIYMFYRWNDTGTPGTDTIKYRTSTDGGATWSSATDVLSKQGSELISPSFQYYGGNWHLWYIDRNPNPNVMYHRSATTIAGLSGASEETVFFFTTYTNYSPDHGTVRFFGNESTGVGELWMSTPFGNNELIGTGDAADPTFFWLKETAMYSPEGTDWKEAQAFKSDWILTPSGVVGAIAFKDASVPDVYFRTGFSSLTVSAYGTNFPALPSAGSTATLTPNGDGTISSTVDTTGAGTYSTEIDEGNDSPSDVDYIENDTTSADASAFFTLSDAPTGLTSITAARVLVRASSIGTATSDTLSLYAQVFRNDETSPLTDEVLVWTHEGSALGPFDFVKDLPNPVSDEADWDNARLRLRWDYTVSTTDALQLRVTATEVRLIYSTTSYSISPPTEAFAFAGYAPTVIASNPVDVTPPVLTLTFSGQVPTLVNPRTVTPPAEALTFTGRIPTVQAGNDILVEPPAEALTFSGLAPTVSNPRTVTPPAESLTFTAQVPTVVNPRTVTPPARTFTFNGLAPTIVTDNNVTVEPGVASFTFAGQVPTLLVPVTITPAVEALTFAGQVPTIDESANITLQIPLQSLTFAGQAPTAATSGNVWIQPGAATFTFTGYAPTIQGGEVVHLVLSDVQLQALLDGTVTVAGLLAGGVKINET